MTTRSPLAVHYYEKVWFKFPACGVIAPLAWIRTCHRVDALCTGNFMKLNGEDNDILELKHFSDKDEADVSVTRLGDASVQRSEVRW